MEAVKFLKESKRLCASFEGCGTCPLYARSGCMIEPQIEEDEETIEAIVEKWSEEHPAKTRQSEFLKMFPNAKIEEGCLLICPIHSDKNEKCGGGRCVDCRKKYWLAEVE